jgi:hypothetical protein
MSKINMAQDPHKPNVGQPPGSKPEQQTQPPTRPLPGSIPARHPDEAVPPK